VGPSDNVRQSAACRRKSLFDGRSWRLFPARRCGARRIPDFSPVQFGFPLSWTRKGPRDREWWQPHHWQPSFWEVPIAAWSPVIAVKRAASMSFRLRQGSIELSDDTSIDVRRRPHHERQSKTLRATHAKLASACAEVLRFDAPFSTPKISGDDSDPCHLPALAEQLYLGSVLDSAELKGRAWGLLVLIQRRISVRIQEIGDSLLLLSVPSRDHVGAILARRGRLPDDCVRLSTAIPNWTDTDEAKDRGDRLDPARRCEGPRNRPVKRSPRHHAEHHEQRSEEQDSQRRRNPNRVTSSERSVLLSALRGKARALGNGRLSRNEICPEGQTPSSSRCRRALRESARPR
jgi:hypothetical protein